MIISHFLLNLRQLTNAPHDGGLDSSPSFVYSHDGAQRNSRPASLRFASFVDNMGASLDSGYLDEDRAADWHIHGNGADSQQAPEDVETITCEM